MMLRTQLGPVPGEHRQVVLRRLSVWLVRQEPAPTRPLLIPFRSGRREPGEVELGQSRARRLKLARRQLGRGYS
jgi:hypothetical protein